MKGGEFAGRKFAALVQCIVDPKVQTFCRLPYPGHPRGCPNWGRDRRCPPAARLMDLKRLTGSVLMVGVEFLIGLWAERMGRLHPDWTERQRRCLLYWQAGVYGLLRDEAAKAMKLHGFSGPVLMLPEAHGVDVTEMMRRNGTPLEWPPGRSAWKVAIGLRTSAF